MNDLPEPRAARLRRPSWRDGRLLTGVLLMLVATVLGGRVVAAADDSVPIQMAARPLVVGSEVQPEDLRSVRVRLGEATSTYLDAEQPVAPGTVVLQPVPAGQLVPASALGTRRDLGLRVVTVPAQADAASVLTVGTQADLWVSVKVDSSGPERYAAPKRALQRATVSRLPDAKEGGLAGTGKTVAVQLLVPGKDVAEVIGYVDREAKITLVPTAGTPLREAQS